MRSHRSHAAIWIQCKKSSASGFLTPISSSTYALAEIDPPCSAKKQHFGSLFLGHGVYVQYNILQPCQHSEDARQNGSKMLCRMPAVNLPDDFSEQLNNREPRTINNKREPGVAVYVSPDRRARADVYIGLILDGFKRYQDISAVNASIKFQFAPKPVVFCKNNDTDFDPKKDSVIAIKVSRIYFAAKWVKWIK